MKGQPCTGKSTVAQRLGQKLKYPVIAHDDARLHIATESEFQQPPPLSSTTTTDVKQLDDISLGVVCQIAATQLSLGRKVILDSSLHLRGHLQTLRQLSIDTEARLVIVECKPRDRYEWRQWLERRCQFEDTCCRYKPSTWEDLENWSELDSGPTDDDMEGISRLILNTTEYVKDSYLATAVQYLAACQGNHCMDFHEWVRNRTKPADLVEEEEGESDEEEVKWEELEESAHFHQLTLQGEQMVGDEISCGGCRQPISDAVYYKCDGCDDLSVHKLCAELPSKKEIWPENYPALLMALPDEYSFPETHRCNNCENSNDDRSFDDCNLCLYQTNLRCALLPSIVLRDFHEHPLHIQLNPFNYFTEFQCNVCGDSGKHASYTCSDCDLSSFECHLGCALLPQTFKHRIHRHPLSLSFNVDKDDDSNEFYCDVCETGRNRNHWIYYCTSCRFTCHLKCRTY
ncbi:hypothetical protein U1Q18_016639 [Sarracenia purpurea var. burkii]